jgi:hypothetical protein
MTNMANEESETLPLTSAYDFLENKGFDKEVAEIRASRDRYKCYTTSLRQGKIVNLLEKNHLLDEFIGGFWRNGATQDGKSKIRRFNRILDAFLNSSQSEDEEEDESINETSFIYEEHLKAYLLKNLNVIESGLTLFTDKDGKEGVEYPIDPENKRIDILAIDKLKNPVVIELKVSRGYEKVVGQCLYYKNRVKELFGVSKVRVIIIAREITSHLRIATAELPDVELFEYNLVVNVRKL